MTAVGLGIILVACTAEWLIKSRLKDPKLQKPLMWIAWGFALLGGVASRDWIHVFHVSHFWAGIVSLLALLWIAVDLRDKRPDWAAVILIAVVPGFIVVVGGLTGLLQFVLSIPGMVGAGSIVGGA